MPGVPSIRILLATYNGDRWLEEQLATLVGQAGVSASIVASDDASTDATPALLESASRRGDLTLLPPFPEKFGNANRNFLRLIRDTALDDVEYFALSDQDDLWLPDKLARSVKVLAQTGADVYSSNVTAFWEDGRRKLLFKSQPQQAFDHLFESAGPGCTFVFRRAVFVELQDWVRTNFETLWKIKVHDWLIYSFARERGWRWTIDASSTLLYRQHERNEAGANTGWRAAVPRIRNILRGHFREDVLAIAAATGSKAPLLGRLARMNWRDRVWLALHVRQYRRAFRDRLVLAALFLVMP